MTFRRGSWLLALAAAVLLMGFPVLARAEAKAKPAPTKAKKTAKKANKTKKKSAKKLVCTGKGKKRKCRRVVSKVSSRSVPKGELRQAPLPRPSGWVHVHVPGLGQELKVNIFNEDGSYDQEALAQLDALWQCKKTKEVRAVDPRLYEVLSMLYDHYGQRIELLSGFRFQRNEGSRHFHASAMDVRVPGVSYKELYAYVQTLDQGGMGIGEYPYMQFVHIDFRAPGQGSVRWTDKARGVDQGDDGKKPSRAWNKPNS